MEKIFIALRNSKPLKWLIRGITIIVIIYLLTILFGNECTLGPKPVTLIENVNAVPAAP